MAARLSAGFAVALIVAFGAAVPAAATITVGNTSDAGPGSLRKAVADAPAGETVQLPAGTYTLTGKPLEVKRSVIIEGAGFSQTVIRSGGDFRVIESSGEVPRSLTLAKLTV